MKTGKSVNRRIQQDLEEQIKETSETHKNAEERRNQKTEAIRRRNKSIEGRINQRKADKDRKIRKPK